MQLDSVENSNGALDRTVPADAALRKFVVKFISVTSYEFKNRMHCHARLPMIQHATARPCERRESRSPGQ